VVRFGKCRRNERGECKIDTNAGARGGLNDNVSNSRAFCFSDATTGDSDVLCGVRPAAATVRRRRVEIRFGKFETDRRGAPRKRRDNEDRQRAAAVAKVRHADVRKYEKGPRIHRKVSARTGESVVLVPG